MSDHPWLIIQARMSSARLPGKVLADLCGRPLLAWLLTRTSQAELLEGVMVATTSSPEDAPISDLCRSLGIPVFRGDREDVLGRFAAAADSVAAASIARVSADSPLLDESVINRVVGAALHSSADIVQNHRPPAWPFGTAVEVFSRETLNELDKLAASPEYREHVTLFAYRHPARFKVEHVAPPPELRAPSLRLCVDTPEDLRHVRAICQGFGGDSSVSLEAIVARKGM
jgi:spore coat polysaccharide biosynthesis protein SpsF